MRFVQEKLNLLWHVYLLLGNDHETKRQTTAVTR
jgi:hypothetical protein